MYVNIA